MIELKLFTFLEYYNFGVSLGLQGDNTLESTVLAILIMIIQVSLYHYLQSDRSFLGKISTIMENVGFLRDFIGDFVVVCTMI